MQESRLNLGYLRLLRAIFFIFIIFSIFMVVYFPRYAKLKKLRRENMKLTSQMQRLQEEIGSLEEKIRRARNDPSFYEDLARDELGVAKKGEIVIDIKE